MPTTPATAYIARCYGCLESYSTLEVIDPDARCVCGGFLERLGQVNDGRLIYTGERTPCDDRCTTASRKKCSCECGGANHATWRLVTFKRDVGASPTVTGDGIDAEACIARAREFRAAQDRKWREFETKFPGAREILRSGGWLQDRAAWDAHRDIVALIGAARKLKTHEGRMRKLGAEHLIGSGHP